MKFERERLDRINARLRPLVQWLADATVPLCQPNAPRVVTFAGSGVLLAIGARKYLLTASHVFENAAMDHPIAVIADRQFVSITSAPRWCTRTAANSPDVPDRADLAIMDLADRQHVKWSGARFLTLAEIDPLRGEAELEPTTSFLLLGYPRSK